MIDESSQNLFVILLGIIGFTVFGVGMFVWMTEKPNRIYNWKFEFPKNKQHSKSKVDSS